MWYTYGDMDSTVHATALAPDDIASPDAAEQQTPPPESALAHWLWVDWVLIGVLGALAFALFGRSTGGIVYPDNSAQVAVEQLGIVPTISPLSTLWSALMRWTANLGPASGMLFRLHLLGRVCAMASAACLYRIVFGVLRGLLFPMGVTRGYSLAMAAVLRLCAVCSSLLLFCPPICHAAAAPHSAIFTTLLAVLAGLSALHFIERRSLASLLLYAAAAAIGCWESPGVLLVMPWWMVIVFLSPEEETKEGDYIGCTFRGHVILSGWASVLWALAAVFLFAGGVLLSLHLFAHSEGASLANLHDFEDILRFYLRRYIGELRQIYPAGGYLLVLLGILAPAALAVTLSPGFFSEKHTFWHILLYTIIGAVSVSQALPASKACLWVYIPSSTMRAGACVLGALSFPFALGFFLITAVREMFPALIALGPNGRERGALIGVEKPLQQLLRGTFFSLLALAFLATPFFSAANQRFREDGKALALLRDYLEELADDIDTRPWAITDRAFDSVLRLVARQRGTHALPLPYALRQDSAERKIASASLTDPLDRDDYAIGTGTLLREWSRHAPEKIASVSILTAPNVWTTTDYKLVPSGLILAPVPEDTPIDMDALLAAQRDVWSRWTNRVDAIQPENRVLRPLLRAVQRQISLTAVEFGYLCESEMRPDIAREAYTAARDMDPLNLVARYNLQALLPSDDPLRESITSEIDDLRSVFDSVPVGFLMCLQGRLRNDAVRQRIAMGEIVRAEMRTSTGSFLTLLQETSADARVSTYRAAASVGAAFLARREWDKARAEYESILAEAPDFLPALYGMAALCAHSEHNADAADPWLQRLRDAGVGQEPTLVFKGLLLKELNEPRKLQQLLEPIVDMSQENQDVWLLWGWAAVQTGNDAAKRMAYQHLSSRGGSRRLELYAAYRDGDVHLISLKHRALLEDAPSDNTLRKAAMGAAWAEADLSSARRLARSVLQEDDRHGPAHFIVGMGFALDGKPEMALPHLERAKEYGLSSVPLFNNLGMVCLELGELDKAHDYAIRALELNPHSPEVADTLVAVEIAQKRFEDAKAHMKTALLDHPESKLLHKRARKIPGFVVNN